MTKTFKITIKDNALNESEIAALTPEDWRINIKEALEVNEIELISLEEL